MVAVPFIEGCATITMRAPDIRQFIEA